MSDIKQCLSIVSIDMINTQVIG